MCEEQLKETIHPDLLMSAVLCSLWSWSPHIWCMYRAVLDAVGPRKSIDAEGWDAAHDGLAL